MTSSPTVKFVRIKLAPTLLTSLLLAPIAALHAADAETSGDELPRRDCDAFHIDFDATLRAEAGKMTEKTFGGTVIKGRIA